MKIKGCSAPQCILKGTPLKVQEMSSLLIYVFNEYKATVTVTDAGLCTVQSNRRVCLQHCWILCIKGEEGSRDSKGKSGKGEAHAQTPFCIGTQGNTQEPALGYTNTGKQGTTLQQGLRYG